MLKNAYLKKTLKIVSASSVCFQRLVAPPSDPRFVIPTYYNNFIKFVSSAKFVDGGCKNISCPRAQGTPATPLIPASAEEQKSQIFD